MEANMEANILIHLCFSVTEAGGGNQTSHLDSELIFLLTCSYKQLYAIYDFLYVLQVKDFTAAGKLCVKGSSIHTQVPTTDLFQNN